MSKCCPGREDNKGQAWSTPQHLPSRLCPFLVLSSGKELVFAGLATPSKQLVISACADRHGLQLAGPYKLLVLLLLIVNHLNGHVNNCALLYPHPERSQVILLHTMGHRWATWQTSLGSQSKCKQDEFAFTHHCHLCPAWFVKLMEGHAVLKETKEKNCFHGVKGEWW